MSRSPVFWSVLEASVGASAVDDIFSCWSDDDADADADEARGVNFALKASTEKDATVKDNNRESRQVFILYNCCITTAKEQQQPKLSEMRVMCREKRSEFLQLQGELPRGTS